jgi:hypothetical protein
LSFFRILFGTPLCGYFLILILFVGIIEGLERFAIYKSTVGHHFSWGKDSEEIGILRSFLHKEISNRSNICLDYFEFNDTVVSSPK